MRLTDPDKKILIQASIYFFADEPVQAVAEVIKHRTALPTPTGFNAD
jgi:hypothetical protein